MKRTAASALIFVMLCLHCAHHCRERLDVPSLHARKIGIEGSGRRVLPTTIAILAAQPNGRDAILFFTLYLSWRNPISALLVSFAAKAKPGDSNA
jgi:hypothetical protein